MFFKVGAKIYIFHHNYLAWDWESKFDYQVTRLLSDGLYDKCECVNFCVIWEKAEDLSHFKHKISAHSKFNLYFHRRKDNHFWGVEAAEGESICKMIDHAHAASENAFYLFFHTKNIFPHNDKYDYKTQRAWVSTWLEKRGHTFNVNDTAAVNSLMEISLMDLLADFNHHIDLLDSFSAIELYLNFFWCQSTLLQELTVKGCLDFLYLSDLYYQRSSGTISAFEKYKGRVCFLTDRHALARFVVKMARFITAKRKYCSLTKNAFDIFLRQCINQSINDNQFKILDKLNLNSIDSTLLSRPCA